MFITYSIAQKHNTSVLFFLSYRKEKQELQTPAWITFGSIVLV